MANREKRPQKNAKKEQGTNKKGRSKTDYQRTRDQYNSSTKSYKRACRENAKIVPRRLDWSFSELLKTTRTALVQTPVPFAVFRHCNTHNKDIMQENVKKIRNKTTLKNTLRPTNHHQWKYPDFLFATIAQMSQIRHRLTQCVQFSLYKHRSCADGTHLMA